MLLRSNHEMILSVAQSGVRRVKGTAAACVLVYVFGVLLFGAALCYAEQSTPRELPTQWEAPPGDPLEHMAAGLAKVLCSAIFITGRDLKTALEEDGGFVAPLEQRGSVTKTVVNATQRAVQVTVADGMPR